MASAERSALIVGEDLARVDAVVPLLRRLNLDVRRAVRGSAASKVVLETTLDLVVVVLPFRQARDFLLLVRGPRSPSRHAAVLLVRGGAPTMDDEGLSPLANRELPGSAGPEEFLLAAELLLNVAPRVEVHTLLRMRLGGSPADQPRLARVENLSTSGMLLSASEPLPVGSVFGFELDLPAQKDPVRGRAQVVRHTPPNAGGLPGIGASFVSLGGEGPERLRSAVFRERAAAGARLWIQGGASRPADLPPVPSPADLARAGRASADDVAMVQEQLDELSPMLDELLRKGLQQRLGTADWYVTGVELGLESLRAFSVILETVYRGHVGTMQTSKRSADLVEVREKLGEFAKPQQGALRRTEILLALRPALERLLRELDDEGTPAGDQSSATRRRGVVSQLNTDIGRLVRSRRSLHELRGELLDLGRPRYALTPGTVRRRALEIARQYGAYGSSLRLDLAQLLTRRRGRKEALVAVEREIQRMDDSLAAIHVKVYSPKFARQKTGDYAVDFAGDRLYSVLAETLAAGYEYLVRAYSAYRHALEAVGADARLLDRVAGLAASIGGASQAPRASMRQAPSAGVPAAEPPRPRLVT
ncbi:MAG TPA: PilZ domain-containing protein [Thermoanaerobaculia bacterium]|nr:PilZ domain-containing protein [Thermoanaerobaculia bacterium]